MQLEQYLPSERLQPFIKHFLVLDSEAGTDNRILPDTSLVIAFRIRGRTSSTTDGIKSALPLSVITGLRKSARLVGYAPQTTNLLVIFREGGAAAFFREPLHELFETSLSLNDLVRRQPLSELEEQLAGAGSNRQRIALVEAFLLSRLQPVAPDGLVLEAVQQISKAQGNVRIKELAAGLHISQDPLEKRFRRIIGATPKQFASLIRFRRLIAAGASPGRLTDAAYTAGYFDQAHFIRDFRSFTGQTPNEYFRSPARW